MVKIEFKNPENEVREVPLVDQEVYEITRGARRYVLFVTLETCIRISSDGKCVYGNKEYFLADYKIIRKITDKVRITVEE